ncbi:MAG: hypothetical protein SGILL_005613 [Bacillariaceae sp.]
MAELMFGLSQTKKKKNEESKVRNTKATLKDVNITTTIEKEVRKEQHDRDQKWKATGRDQIKKNTNFDMARSLFGGGGPAPANDDSEDDEVEQVTQELQNTHVDDDASEAEEEQSQEEPEEPEEYESQGEEEGEYEEEED